MVPEWLAIILMVYCYAMGFLVAWAISRDGVSPLWTGFMDVFTLRILFKRAAGE